ncbi:MAG: hypothetical protein AAF789_04545 [Bacteroidota bacterium]
MKKLLIIVLFLNSWTLLAIEKNFEIKKVSLELPVSASQDIALNMKNTKLRLETWGESKIAVEATLRVNGKINEKRQEFLNDWEARVRADVESFGSTIEITSPIESAANTVKKTFLGLLVYYSEGNVDKAFEATYVIKVPSGNGLRIKGSYEDVQLLGDIDDLELELYSADLLAGNLKKAELELKYGQAEIKRIQKGDVTLYEYELESNQLDELKLNAKYSELQVEQIGTMEMDAYETKLYCNTLKSAVGEMKYGQFNTMEKAESVDLTTYEVDCEFGEVTTVIMQSKYGKIKADMIGSLRLQSSYEDEFEIERLGNLSSFESKYGEYRVGVLKNSFELKGYEDDVQIRALATASAQVQIGGKYIETVLGTGGLPITLDIIAQYGNLNFDESQMKIERYVKDGSKKEVKAKTKGAEGNRASVKVAGYEMDVTVN